MKLPWLVGWNSWLHKGASTQSEEFPGTLHLAAHTLLSRTSCMCLRARFSIAVGLPTRLESVAFASASNMGQAFVMMQVLPSCSYADKAEFTTCKNPFRTCCGPSSCCGGARGRGGGLRIFSSRSFQRLKERTTWYTTTNIKRIIQTIEKYKII
jgi:hypothetical protein